MAGYSFFSPPPHEASLGRYQYTVKYGFRWIVIIKAHFKGRKSQISIIYHLDAFSQNLWNKLFSILWKRILVWVFCYFLDVLKNGLLTFLSLYTASWGYYWSTVKRWIWSKIIRKVICKVGKVSLGPFSRNYRYYPVVTKGCLNWLHLVTCFLWIQSCPKYENCAIALWVIFKVRIVHFGISWSVWANISETLHAMTNVSHIKSHHIILVCIKIVDLIWHLMVK